MSPEEWLASQNSAAPQQADTTTPVQKVAPMSPEEWALSQKKKDKGFFGNIKEAITGSERSTPESQSLPEWVTMPELADVTSMASLKAGLGTFFANPKEAVQVIQSNFPGTQVRQDEKGNYILKSSIDNKEYVIPPGFKWGDVPRAVGTAVAYTPAGRALTIPQMILRSAMTQLAIEGTQAATGGEANPEEVVAAGMTAPIVPIAGAGLKAVGQAAKPVVMGAINTAAPGLGHAIEKIGNVISPTKEAAKSVAQAVPEQAAVDTSAVKTAVQAIPEQQVNPKNLADILKKAAGNSLGSVKAKEQLAAMSKINPEAKAAAERLGIELPADVFSDNPQIRAAVGLTRSAAGSESEAAWRNAVTNAVDKADDAIKKFDAVFVEGSPSIGTVSQNVRDTLTKVRSELNADAKKVYEAVDNAVPKDSLVKTTKLKETLAAIKKEVGAEGMSSQESRLLKMAESSDLTYGRVIREKNLIGQAMAKKDSPYGNMEAGALKRLYAALSEDQLDNVGKIGGEELRKQLRGANLIYAKERALGRRIVNSFGQDSDGSIANLIRSSITSASKGDSTQFSKLMKVVPDDLKKETLATAIASVSRSTRGAEKGDFGFSEFANTYRGLRANPPVYAQIVKTLGDDSHKVMRDLYEVSKRVTEARANVLTTGKANQALVESLNAEGLVAKIMNSTATKGALTGVSAMGGGPIGAAATSVLINTFSNGKKDAINAAGKLFASPEFQKLAVEAGTKQEVGKEAIKEVIKSSAFKKYANSIKLPMSKSEQFLLDGLQAKRQLEGKNNASN